jgi:hypothetical protein
MGSRDLLKQILVATRNSWDRPETRSSVRHNFDMITKCRTLALGAEVFCSQSEKKIVPHTCKARFCPSCGHRATLQWQREQFCALPDGPYSGVVFTMPRQLWSLFQQNRHLLHDLPSIGAAVIQQWVKLKYGARVTITVIPHTFGSQLNFNSHLHVLVSAIALVESQGQLLQNIAFRQDKLMHMWRFAVISFLRAALDANVLGSEMRPSDLQNLLSEQYRWWSVRVDRFTSKEHFLRYAGRYVRRPPVAQYHIQEITNNEVQFRRKVKIDGRKQWTVIRWTLQEFVSNLAQHVPDRYSHSVRHFGLLSPRSKAKNLSAVFMLLGQTRHPAPRRLGWAFSIRRHFGVDPLADKHGARMHWAGRLNACS